MENKSTKPIEYGDGWFWYPDEDRFVKEDFVVTGDYAKDHSHGRTERVHIVATLERILNDYKLKCMYSEPL